MRRLLLVLAFGVTTVHFDIALDQDDDVLNDITCRLLEHIST